MHQRVYQVFPTQSSASASPHQRRLHGDDIPSAARSFNAPSTTLPAATMLPAVYGSTKSVAAVPNSAIEPPPPPRCTESRQHDGTTATRRDTTPCIEASLALQYRSRAAACQARRPTRQQPRRTCQLESRRATHPVAAHLGSRQDLPLQPSQRGYISRCRNHNGLQTRHHLCPHNLGPVACTLFRICKRRAR